MEAATAAEATDEGAPIGIGGSAAVALTVWTTVNRCASEFESPVGGSRIAERALPSSAHAVDGLAARSKSRRAPLSPLAVGRRRAAEGIGGKTWEGRVEVK